MNHRSLDALTNTSSTATAKILQHPDATHTNMVYPFAKKAGFTDRLLTAIKAGFSTIFLKVNRALERRSDRIIATQLLNMEDGVLDDLALTRGDVNYVLATKSAALATERLRLIGLERRAGQKADFRRRAQYLSELTPALPPVARGSNALEKLTN